MEQEDKFRNRAIAYYNSKTPCHIVTEQDSWINGYISEKPNEFFFIVLDKEGQVKVHYIDIRIFEEYVGDKNKIVKILEEN